MIDFENFLKLLKVYEIKQVPRSSSNSYFDEKIGTFCERSETAAEHVCSALKLADFFLTEPEFVNVDRLRVYELLLYHDDVEIETRSACIDDPSERLQKERDEIRAVPILAKKYPRGLEERLLRMDEEFRALKTPEAKFARYVDKFDVLVQELQYRDDWTVAKFTEEVTRKWFQPAFVDSPTFTAYFERTMQHLRENGYF